MTWGVTLCNATCSSFKKDIPTVKGVKAVLVPVPHSDQGFLHTCQSGHTEGWDTDTVRHRPLNDKSPLHRLILNQTVRPYRTSNFRTDMMDDVISGRLNWPAVPALIAPDTCPRNLSFGFRVQ